MNTLRAMLAVALAIAALWAQAPQGGDGEVKGKAGGGEGKAGRGGRAGEAKALAPPPDPQVLRLLRPDLFLITGEGGNSVFRVTPEGVILVDTKSPNAGNFERLTELIRGVTQQPVKFVVNTLSHPEHSGNSDRLKAAGADLITADQASRLKGLEVRRAGNLTLVYFPAERVIAVGDALGNRAPSIDYAGGGSLAGTVQALDTILGLQWDVAIPGHGEPVNRTFVEGYRIKLRTLIDRAREAVARGAAKEQLVAQIKTDDLGWQLQMDAAQLDGFFGEMSALR